MVFNIGQLAVFAGLYTSASIVSGATIKSSPIVDLGSAVHEATVNTTGHYYTFTNIRYAAAPIGNLRFAAPTPPNTVNRSVQKSRGKISCFQGHDGPAISKFNGREFTGDPNDLIQPDPSETEDCLFLNIQVPSAVFDKKKKAPVLVWIHGGAYAEGSKDPFDGSGLIAQSKKNGGDGILFVALNYRLGIFGFLSGPTFQVEGTVNAGLLDQRFALEWIQKNIHKFGGDPNKVTLMGQSAGGGSVIHQLTAYGGLKGKAPFQQAIPQSSGYIPLISANQQETYYNTALSTASALSGSSITTLSQLRGLPTKVLQTTNSLLIGFTSNGGNPYSPVVDGAFAPALQSHLFLHGQYDKSVKVLVSYVSREAGLTTPPIPNDPAYVNGIMKQLLPQASQSVVDTILNDLYPDVMDGSQGYTDQHGRLEKANSEGYGNCNGRYVSKAFSSTASYAYYVTIPPGYHGVDIAYTFFNGNTSASSFGQPINPKVARDLQSYLTNFVLNGDPNGKGLPKFPVYGSAANTLTVGLEDFGKVIKDPGANERCDFWQKALWY